MNIIKNLAIRMDHTKAHLMEYETGNLKSRVILSSFNQLKKKDSLKSSEKQMHHKEMGETSTYYQQISEEILKYTNVLIFGPTDAKLEMLNILQKDRRFEKIQFEVLSTDVMTENQERAFVKSYFTHNEHLKYSQRS